jgi:hypothetical protein
MADLSITAANVKLGNTDTRIGVFTAGEALTQGQPVYLSSTDSKYYQTDANDGAAKAEAKGIALTPASADGAFVLASDGLVNLGTTLTVGQIYVVSTTKGGIAPVGDLASTNYTTILGVATTTALLDIQIQISGVQKP